MLKYIIGHVVETQTYIIANTEPMTSSVSCVMLTSSNMSEDKHVFVTVTSLRSCRVTYTQKRKKIKNLQFLVANGFGHRNLSCDTLRYLPLVGNPFN